MSSVTDELDERSRARLGKACRNLIAVDDQLRDSRARTRALLETKRRREANLLKLFGDLGFDDREPCDVSGRDGEVMASLRPSVSRRKAPVKKTTIQAVLMEVLDDPGRVDEICAKIEDRREIKEVPYVRRTNKRPR